MTDTIIDMDYRLVDTLNSDQLEPEDLIGLGDEVVKIISISPMKFGFVLTYENEFGEKDIVEIGDDEQFDLYVLDQLQNSRPVRNVRFTYFVKNLLI